MSRLQGKNILYMGGVFTTATAKLFNRLGTNIAQLASKPGVQSINGLGLIINEESDAEIIIQELKNNNFMPDAIYAGSDKYTQLKAQLSEHYNIPYIGESIVPQVVEKTVMRKVLSQRDPDISPRFKKISSISDLDEFMNIANFPIILKPSGLDSSLLVTKVSSRADAIDAFKLVSEKIDQIYSSRPNSIKAEILAEEYMMGAKYSVEAIIDESGVAIYPSTVTDLVFGYDVGVDDPSNISRIVPSAATKELQNELFLVTTRSIKALDIKSCTIHAELIATENGVKLIEVAARVGGFREALYTLAFGYSLIEADLEMQTLGTASLNEKYRRHSAAIKLWSYEEGELAEIIGIENIDKYNTLEYHIIKQVAGEKVGPAKLGYKDVLLIVLSSDNREEMLEDHDDIIKNIRPTIVS
jgi:hypothetical protein